MSFDAVLRFVDIRHCWCKKCNRNFKINVLSTPVIRNNEWNKHSFMLQIFWRFIKIPFIQILKHLDFTNYNYTKTKIYHSLQQKKKHVWKTKGKSQNSSWFSHNMNTYTPWTLTMTSHVYYISFKYFIQNFYNHVSIPFKNFPKRLETSTEYVNFYSLIYVFDIYCAPHNSMNKEVMKLTLYQYPIIFLKEVKILKVLIRLISMRMMI